MAVVSRALAQARPFFLTRAEGESSSRVKKKGLACETTIGVPFSNFVAGYVKGGTLEFPRID